MDDHAPRPDKDAGAPSPRARRAPVPRPRDAALAGDAADRLSSLAHELRNILDGSLRCLSLAERALPGAVEGAPSPDEARRRLDSVRQSLHRMAELVNATMQGGAPLVAAADAHAVSIELGEAVFHAVDVLTPMAADHGASIKARVSNGLSGVPAGPLYSVVVNGVRNAIEAIGADAGRGPDSEPGVIEVVAEWTEDGRVRIAIADNGPGLPECAGDAVFGHGFTTKPGGSGLGLAISRTIVAELPEGSIRLLRRVDRPQGGRPGAVLEICYRPAPCRDC